MPVPDHSNVLGKTGRVTGLIAPNGLGEVIIPVRGGADAYLARAQNANETIAIGTRIRVVEFYPPRTVYVSPLE